jgi:hypothetical protein
MQTSPNIRQFNDGYFFYKKTKNLRRKSMRKFIRVSQEEGETSLVQIDFCNEGRYDGRFAGITVIEGPSLTFGQWLNIFKKEILEKYHEDVERVLNQYNDFYRNALVEAREMFRSDEDVNWNKMAIRTAFEKCDNEAGTEYRFIEKIYTDPMFETGKTYTESFFITNNWEVGRRIPKNIFVICALWKYFNWNQFIEEVTYEEFEPKEYDWNVNATTVSVTDIIG